MNTAIAIQTETAKVRWSNALKTLRAVGIATRMNVKSCCRSCANIDTDRATVWTFGGQGNAFSWLDGTMVNREILYKVKARSFGGVTLDSMKRNKGIEEQVFFNFTDIIAAEAAVIAFEAEGFEVEWNGTEGQCVIIKM